MAAAAGRPWACSCPRAAEGGGKHVVFEGAMEGKNKSKDRKN